MTAAFSHPPVHSPWFDLAEQAPWEPGVYQVQTSAGGFGQPVFSRWSGKSWGFTASSADVANDWRRHPTGRTITRWRGIVPPSRLPRFVSESWAEACARLPALTEFSEEIVNKAHVPGVLYAVDCMPGYELWQFAGGVPGVLFIFRRRDPS